MPTAVSYPTGRTVGFNVGVGMHDISLLATGNGWSAQSITARAGGGQANATPVAAGITLIAICATAGDSVILPPAVGGQLLWVINGGVAAAQIFTAIGGGGTINGIAGTTGISLAAGKAMTLISPIGAAWFGVLSA